MSFLLLFRIFWVLNGLRDPKQRLKGEFNSLTFLPKEAYRTDTPSKGTGRGFIQGKCIPGVLGDRILDEASGGGNLYLC